MEFPVRYYDGMTAVAREAVITPGDSGLHIRLEAMESRLLWQYADLHIPDKPETGRPLMIINRTQNNARLAWDGADRQLYESLCSRLPAKNRPGMVISLSIRSIAFWAVAAMVLIVLTCYTMPPLAASGARHFPPAWSERLGNYAVNALAVDMPVCSDTEGNKALAKIVNVLAAHAKGHPFIEVRVIYHTETNAFTVPGGKIFLFSQLIDNARTPEEIAGVIAHEIGHSIRHHPEQAVVRTLGWEIVINMAFGGAGNPSSTAALASNLLQMRYNRAFEREADSVATQLLYDAHIDHQGFIDFFLRMQSKETGRLTELLSYISTHPSTPERIEAIAQSPNSHAPNPLLDREEWHALQHICKSRVTLQ